MTIKNFHFSQFANLYIQGAGMHGSYSLSLVVRDKNTPEGKKIYISATGTTNAVKAAGSGKALFWCKIKNSINTIEYHLDRKFNERFAVGPNDILIGSTEFSLNKNNFKSPSIIIEGGYILSDYTGQIVPFPKILKRIINLTPF